MPNSTRAKVFLLLVCAVGWLSGCASTPQQEQAEPPQWLLSLEDVYPQKDFMAALGEGDSLSEAQQIATGNLAARFRTRVSSKAEAKRNFSSSGSGANEINSRDSSSSQHVATEADETLLGVSYNTPYQRSDGRVFVVAYLDREKVGRIYRQQIEDSNSRITQLLQQARQPDTGKLFGYSLIHSAYALAQENQRLLDQLALINPTQRKFTRIGYELSQIQKLRTDYMRSLTFSVQLSYDDSLLSGVEQLIEQSLQDLGFPLSSEGEAVVKVQGSLTLDPVNLENGYKNVFWQIKLDVTDDQGKVVVSYSDEGRESGRTLQRAKLSLLQYLKKRINTQVANKLLAYINGFDT